MYSENVHPLPRMVTPTKIFQLYSTCFQANSRFLYSSESFEKISDNENFSGICTMQVSEIFVSEKGFYCIHVCMRIYLRVCIYIYIYELYEQFFLTFIHIKVNFILYSLLEGTCHVIVHLLLKVEHKS